MLEQLARRAGRAGGTAPAVLNGANEVCVDAFFEGRLGFLGITDVTFVPADGLAMDRDAALARAQAALENIAA